MSRDFARPRAPKRVADLLRHLSEAGERDRARRRRLADGVRGLLEAPVEGPEGLLPAVRALAAAAPEVDGLGVLTRSDAGFAVVAGLGLLEGEHPPERARLPAEVFRARRPALLAGGEAGAPFAAGTRAAAALPILSRGEVLGVAVAGSRSATALREEDLLLLALLAERAGRALERRALVSALGGAETAVRGTSAFRDQVLAIVGHDLRNPLGAIAMSAALLQKRGDLGGWQAKTVGRVRSSAARMGRIIDDLLSYTRARLGGGIPVERREADLGELARKVVDELVALHPDTPVRLSAAGDLAGRWDPTRVEQALSNLVANAIDHGEPGATVEVALRADGDGVAVEVTNRGEAPPEVVAHAFEPFQRGPEERSRRSTGLGLGLWIAHEIVRSHGGVIALRSAGGVTRVTVTLPRREGAAAEARPG